MAEPNGGDLQGCTIGQFLASLELLELLAPKEMEALRRQYHGSRESHDSQSLAKSLVAAKTLTKYQATAIYQGRAKELLVGPYKILGRLGSGGMGTVFKAVHRDSGNLVAVKIVLNSAKSPEIIQRFQREARAAAALEHPNIVRAIEFGDSDGQHFFAMEYIDGADLGSSAKKQRRLSVEEAVGYTVQAARGLAYAHAQGIVHRDIKPGNLLVDRNGQVKILDLGLARFTDPSAAAEAQADQGLTQTGDVMGTIDYMAPEQAFNMRLADARADIYSLGCTLYRLISGRKLYSGESIVEKILAHREQPIPSMRAGRNDVPDALDRVFRRSVAKRPEDRYQNMDDFADDLQRSLTAPDAVTAPAVAFGMPPLKTGMLPPVPMAAQPGLMPNLVLQPMLTPSSGVTSLPHSPVPIFTATQAATTTTPRTTTRRTASRTSADRDWFRFGLWGAGGMAAVAICYFALIVLGGPAFDFLNVWPQSPRIVARTEPKPPAAKPMANISTPSQTDATQAAIVPKTPAAPLPVNPPENTTVSAPDPEVKPTASPVSPPNSTPTTVASSEPAKPTPPPTTPAKKGKTKGKKGARPSNSVDTSPPETDPPADSAHDARLAAIDAGLKWLASAQQSDGSWTFATGPDRGEKASPHGATGIALLILLRAGNTNVEGEYRKQVDGGLRHLLVRQLSTAGNYTDDGNMYSQALVTLALCEAYETLQESRFKLAAQRAINFIVFSQDPKGGGWRYTVREAGDLSVTGWQLQALLAAKANQLTIPDISFKGVKYFIEQLKQDRGVAYRYMNGHPSSPTTSAIGLYGSLELGAPADDPIIVEGARLLLNSPPSNNAYQNYYVTRLMWKLGGTSWTSWDKQITRRLIASQETVSGVRGSWNPDQHSLLGKGGGRFAQTAFNLLTLQIALE